MKHRSLASVIILTLITFGIYGIVWEVKTTREMRKFGASIPNCILIIIPLANIYWLWRYSEGVERVTKGKWSAALVFLLFFLTGIGGMILAQLAFNEDTSTVAAEGSTGPSGTATVPSSPTGAQQVAPAVGGAAGAAMGSQPQQDITPAPVASSDSATEVASAPETPDSTDSSSTNVEVASAPETPDAAPETTPTEEPTAPTENPITEPTTTAPEPPAEPATPPVDDSTTPGATAV